jgi:glycosyltransferase involved in cell wall biosynthesis
MTSLSIVIPCKNEERYIGKLLDDLAQQSGINNIPIYIADANSTDNTLNVIRQKVDQYPYLTIQILPGGNVSYGRNKGASFVSTEYVVFIDADVRFYKTNTLVTSTSLLKSTGKRLLTCKLKSYSPDIRSKVAFYLYNKVHSLLIRKYPFAIGAYFFLRTIDFRTFGGFNVKSDNSEDFIFSQNFTPSEFIVLDHYIGQDDRRFKTIGYIGMLKHLLINLYNYIKHGKTNFVAKTGYWG